MCLIYLILSYLKSFVQFFIGFEESRHYKFSLIYMRILPMRLKPLPSPKPHLQQTLQDLIKVALPVAFSNTAAWEFFANLARIPPFIILNLFSSKFFRVNKLQIMFFYLVFLYIICAKINLRNSKRGSVIAKKSLIFEAISACLLWNLPRWPRLQRGSP